MENALLGVNIANDNSYLITMAKFIIPFTIILFGIDANRADSAKFKSLADLPK